MKIYTRTGDKGETGLFDGTRVSKADPRVEAYGAVDETNALLGVAAASTTDAELRGILHDLQRDLFAVGAQLADPKWGVKPRKEKTRLTEGRVTELETLIDRAEAELPALKRFILPGGSQVGAVLHLARTVCRRAERRMVALTATAAVAPLLITYVNRLSDLLFVLARLASRRDGCEEIPW
ncbi:MAG: cob(I)yrinic acid a,c-diamide adenosyltransferase [Candidatus Methylomirabilales bacterium]